ncbi:MAG: hypothetical protein R3C16_07165 [Hyphomonadaceae bacterium]
MALLFRGRCRSGADAHRRQQAQADVGKVDGVIQGVGTDQGLKTTRGGRPFRA